MCVCARVCAPPSAQLLWEVFLVTTFFLEALRRMIACGRKKIGVFGAGQMITLRSDTHRCGETQALCFFKIQCATAASWTQMTTSKKCG